MTAGRSRLSTILLVAILVAMIFTGIALYSWLDDVKDAEATQLIEQLNNIVDRVLIDVALEFTAITTLFSTGYDITKEKRPASEFLEMAAQYPQAWLRGTRFPGLIETFFFVDRSGQLPALLRYDSTVSRFVLDPAARPRILDDDEATRFGEITWLDSSAEAADFKLSIPVERYFISEDRTYKQSVTVGEFVIVFDSSFFATNVAAALLRRYLRLDYDPSYSFAVVAEHVSKTLLTTSAANSSNPVELIPGRVDKRVELTAWGKSSESLIDGFISRDLVASDYGSKFLDVRLIDIVLRQWYALSRDETVTIKDTATVAGDSQQSQDHEGEGNQRIDGASKSRESYAESGIYLYIWHREGSVQRHVRILRNQRLAIGCSVLAAFAIVAVIYYLLFRRAQRLRDREHEFVATVTHELRTPIAAVQAVGDNLSDGIIADPEKVRTYGSAVLEHGKRLRVVIEQMLLFSGISDSERKITGEEICLDILVASVVKRYGDKDRARLISRVQRDMAPVRHNSYAIETILSNLLSNAFKHGGKQSSVTLTVRLEANVLNDQSETRILVIRVSDTGPGIPKRELKKVFTPFFRGAGSRNMQTPGSGLGLSLVRKIAQRSGGTISINSSIGRGTTATVRLPLLTRPVDDA